MRYTSANKDKLLIICLAFLLQLISASKIGFTANHKYFYVDLLWIQNTQIQVRNDIDWRHPLILTIPLPQTFIGINSSQFQASAIIGQLLQTINIFAVFDQLHLTSMNLGIYTSNASTIQKITIAYVVWRAFSENQNYFEGVQIYYYKEYFPSLVSNSFYVQLDKKLTYPILPNGTIQIPIMLSGIVATSDNSSIIELSFSATIVNTTILRIYIGSKQTELTYLFEIQLQVFIYNKDYVNSDQSHYFNMYNNILVADQGTQIKYNTNLEITSMNTLVGISSFSLTNQTTFGFSLAIDQANGITVSLESPFNANNYYNFTSFIVLSNYCDYTTPFFESLYGQCESTCPWWTTANDTLLECQCYQNNILVNNSNCYPIIVDPPVPLIAGLIVGSVVFIALLIIFIWFIHRKCKNKQLNYQQKVRVQIVFNSSVKKIDNDQHDNNNSLQHILARGEQPKYQNINDALKKLTKIGDKWRQAPEQFKKEQTCCICLKGRTFLLSSCKHKFHLTCLFKWYIKSKDCPFCRFQMKDQFKYYCIDCGFKYRIIELGCENIDEDTFQRVCEECKQIPL